MLSSWAHTSPHLLCHGCNRPAGPPPTVVPPTALQARAQSSHQAVKPHATHSPDSPNTTPAAPVAPACAVTTTSSSSSSSPVESSSAEGATLLQQLAGPFPSTLVLPGASLPPLATAHHFVNLTNGLEALPLLTQLGLSYSFCRLRSTALEQQALEQFIGEVDVALLMAAALGHTVVVWDCGARSPTHGTPRALWMGLELLRFVLTRSWWGLRQPAVVKGHDLSRDWEAAFRGFHQRTLRRLKYYQRFVEPGREPEVELYGAYKGTAHDGDVEHWVQLARGYTGAGQRQGGATAGAYNARSGVLACDDTALAAAMLEEGYALLGPGLTHEQLAQLKRQQL